MPKKNRIFFITTNYCWGASEYLWYETIKQMHTMNYDVFAYIYKYSHVVIDQLQEELGSNLVFNGKKLPVLRFYKRWLNKFYPFFKQKDTLQDALTSFKPDLVVISKGNAFGDEDIPLFIKGLGFNYIIVNHLVTQASWPLITGNSREKLSEGIGAALKNYFVSHANSRLFQKMVCAPVSNSEVVFNPLLNMPNQELFYPDTSNGYQVALVGRLECFHKGYDLLIEVVKQEKWQKRPIIFNIYGQGPHEEIIENWIKNYKLKNIKLRGFVKAKSDIWRNNHILLLPSRMEGQSISLSEALCSKRSVIGTDIGGISEYIVNQETGFIANNANVTDLDEAMERAWEKREEWKSMGEKANEAWKKIAPEKPIAYFINQITSLI